jgi:indolepyruvate ferredoxin oxidoreductase beta subunit
MAQLSKKAWFINASEIALRLGNALITNIVMTGALLGTELLPIERTKVEDQLKSNFKGEKLALNIEAFDLGYEAVKGAH